MERRTIYLPRSLQVLGWAFVLTLAARALIDGLRLWLAWGRP